MDILMISEREIRGNGPGLVFGVCWRQWRAERALARRGIRFRSTSFPQVVAAYGAMSQAEFDAVNGRQDWANWRTIPRAMNGQVSNRPLRALDLGCGSGSSTQVLAHYCPAGSHITGYEIAEPLLAFAARRTYRQRAGGKVRVDFVCQGVTQEFRQVEGSALADGSVHLINASGVVGHHLNPRTFEPLLAEVQRVLESDGVVLLDVGPTLPARCLRNIMAEAGFVCMGHHRSWFGDMTGEMVFRRAPVAAEKPPAGNNQRCTLAEPPLASASTSSDRAMVTSP